MLDDPVSGQSYPTLNHNLRQSALDEVMEKTRAEVVKFRDKLYLNDGHVRNLNWAVSIMWATDLKEKSSHPAVLEHHKLQTVHEQVDAAARKLSDLDKELSVLIEFHRKHKSSAADVFENLRSAATGYAEARMPSWGPQPRRSPAWYQDAHYLMTLLNGVAERRTKRPASFANEEAPAIKFIWWALREERSPEAITKALTRYRRTPR
jgi:hypothetical protein